MPKDDPASDMNDNKETVQAPESQRPESRARYASARPLTPPPPSAPGEFLKAQCHPVRLEAARPPGPAPVTPPPASVPAEFLASQQWKEPSGEGPAGLMENFLASAASSSPGGYDSGIWPLQWREEEPAAAGSESVADAGEPVRVRGVPLARGEEIIQALLPGEGLSDTPPPSGQALILTNRRLIAFRGAESFRDTHMTRTSGISQFSVRTGQRNWTAVLQGILMMVGGGLLYLVVGYWLAGRISGPSVPVLNIDVAPLIALLILLAGLLVFLQNYFARPEGAVIFRGTGIELAFPFHGALDVKQIYEFVDLVQMSTQRNGGGPDAETLEEG